jgi:hypothetical protein
MTIIYVIVGLILTVVVAGVLIFYIGGKRNPRKESLVILRADDSIEIAFSDDRYTNFDISDIRLNERFGCII